MKESKRKSQISDQAHKAASYQGTMWPSHYKQTAWGYSTFNFNFTNLYLKILFCKSDSAVESDIYCKALQIL